MRAPLGGESHPVAAPRERLADDLLAPAAAVAVRGVDVVDAPFDRVADDLRVVDREASEADLVDLRVRPAEGAVTHRRAGAGHGTCRRGSAGRGESARHQRAGSGSRPLQERAPAERAPGTGPGSAAGAGHPFLLRRTIRSTTKNART